MDLKAEAEELLSKIVVAIVDQPDQVSIKTVQGPQTCVFEIRVAPTDVGKIIGKQGTMAQALRKIVTAIATKGEWRGVIEIIDP